MSDELGVQIPRLHQLTLLSRTLTTALEGSRGDQGVMRMKAVTCPCGFEVKDHNTDELVKIVQLHAEQTHKKDYPKGMTREQVLQMARDV